MALYECPHCGAVYSKSYLKDIMFDNDRVINDGDMNIVECNVCKKKFECWVNITIDFEIKKED